MEDILEILLSIIFLVVITFVPLAFYYFIGKHFEQKHFADIKKREARFIQMSLVPSDTVDPVRQVEAMGLVTGQVVIGSDPFKRYIAALVNLVGGNVAVFETLIDRARREAVLRMKERASALHADEVVNFRLETMSLCGGKQAKPMGIVEVLAYGTAVRYKKEQV